MLSTKEIHLNICVDYIAFPYVRLKQPCWKVEQCLVLSVVYRLIQNRWSDIWCHSSVKKYIQDLHEICTGLAKSQPEAHNTIYWPGIDGNIVYYIYHCRVSIQSKPSQDAEYLLSHRVSWSPWQDIGITFFCWDNQDYFPWKIGCLGILIHIPTFIKIIFLSATAFEVPLCHAC